MFEAMVVTHDKLQSGQLITSRGGKQHSAALLPAAFGTANEEGKMRRKVRVLYIVRLSILVNVWKVKINLASVCVSGAKSAFRRQGPAFTYFSQGYYARRLDHLPQ
jgi:hypothetical protein